MEETTSAFMGFLGVVSILSLLIGLIILFNLIQRAFDREGVLWGLISVVYPPGTYVYCRRHWEAYGKKFVTITALLVVGSTLWLLVRYL